MVAVESIKADILAFTEMNKYMTKKNSVLMTYFYNVLISSISVFKLISRELMLHVFKRDCKILA